MAITYKSAGTGVATEASGGNLNPTCPATVDANDILIAHVGYEGVVTTPSTPSGWTLLGGPYTIESIHRHWIFGKIAAGTEDGAAVSFGTPAVTTVRTGRIYSFAGWVSGLIFGNVPAASFAHLSHATDPQMPTVATTVAGALAVAAIWQEDDNAQASATGASGGTWTEAVAEYIQSATTPDTGMGLQTCTPTGNPGTVSGGSVATTNDICGVIAFEIRATAVAQAVTGVTISPGNQRFAPTVAAGAVAVTGGTIASGNQRFAPTVVLEQAVTTGTRAGASVLYAPTVSPDQAVVGGSIATGNQRFVPTVAAGAVTVGGGTIASGNQRFAPNLSYTQSVSLETIEAGSLLFRPLVARHISYLVDAFASFDTTVWDKLETQATVSVVAGRLHIASDTGRVSGLARGTIFTKGVYDLTDGAILVEVFPGDNSPAQAQTYLYLENQASPFENLQITVNSDTDEILFEYNGDLQVEAFDPVQDRWWRVRHDQATNKVHLETSPDGLNWTSRRNDTPTSSIENMYVEMKAFWVFDTPANETPAEFDNVNVPPQVLIGGTIASGNQLFAPTVFYPQAVVGGTIASGNQRFAPTVAVGAVTVTSGTIASGNQRFAPTVRHAVTTSTIASGNQRFAPMVSYEVAGATIASGSSLFAPTLTVGAVDVAGAHIASTLTMFAATVQLEGGVAGAHISSTLAMFAPAIVAEPAVSTAHIGSTAQLFAPTERYEVVSGTIASGNARFAPSVARTVTAGTRASAVQMFAPSISSTSAITGGTIASGLQTFAPTVRRVVTTSTIPSGNQRFAPTLAYAVTAGTRASGAVAFAPAVALGTFIDLSFIPSGAELFPPFVGDRNPSQTADADGRIVTFDAADRPTLTVSDARDLSHESNSRTTTYDGPTRPLTWTAPRRS